MSKSAKKKHDGVLRSTGWRDAGSILEVCKAPSINVLLVGRSSVGKSTIIRTLIDPAVGGKRMGYSQTKEAFCETLCVTDHATGKQYQLTIVDTPGLQEYFKGAEVDRRDDEVLLNLSAKFMTHNITRLHAVCFVSEAGRTQLQDLAPFRKIMGYLGPDFSSVSMMVLTNAESITVDKKKQFDSDISSDPLAGEFYKFCQQGICFMGCLDLDQLEGMAENGLSTEVLQTLRETNTKKVCEMRDHLLQKFFEAAQKDPIPIRILEDCRKEYTTKVEEILKNKAQTNQAPSTSKPASFFSRFTNL